MIKIGLLLIQLSAQLEDIKWLVATRKDEQATFEDYAKLIGSQESKRLQKPPQLVETERLITERTPIWCTLFRELIQELIAQVPDLTEDHVLIVNWSEGGLKRFEKYSSPDTGVSLMKEVFRLIKEYPAVFSEGG